MSGYLVITALTLGVSSLGSCVVGIVAVMRARREDIPAVVSALNRRSSRIKMPESRAKGAKSPPQHHPPT